MGKSPQSDLDRGLSKVHPAFLETARKRVRAIEKFLAGERSSEDLRATAQAIGLSVSRTGRLVRSYELHRDPTLVSGEGHRGSRQPASDRRAFIREAIQSAIRELGTAAQAADVENAVKRSCEEVSIIPPSVQLVWKSLARARRQNRLPATGINPVTVIGRLWFQLPVQSPRGGAIERPEALIAMDLPSKQIRACTTSLYLGRVPVISDLDSESQGEPIRVSSIELGNLTEKENGFPVVPYDAAQNTLIRYLGNGIGQLEVLFRRPRTDAQILLNRGAGKPLTPDQAAETVRLAILRHHSELQEAAGQTSD